MNNLTFYSARKALLWALLLILSATSLLGKDIKKLKGLKIDSIGIFIDSTFLRLPGYEFPVAFKVITPQGVLYTKGLGGGKVRWSNFDIEVNGGRFFNGKIIVSEKLLPGEYIEIRATCPDQPGLFLSKIIRLNYVNKLHLFPVNSFQKIPGERFNFGIKVNYDNGCFENITSWNDYKLMNSLQLRFRSFGGKVTNNRFHIESEIDRINFHKVGLIATTPHSPFVSDTLGITLDYKGRFTYYAHGISGRDGCNGADGSPGRNGSDSENGTPGCRGDDGADGEEGRRGDDLEVFCDAYFDTILNTELLYVEVKNMETNRVNNYLVNPVGGSIIITSKGGSGGRGGNGGNGGRGGNGGDGKKYTVEIKDSTKTITETHQEKGAHGAQGGNGGHGGYGGHGGNGGDIYIYYTETAQKYLSCIEANSVGGNSGSGGFSGNGGSGGSGGNPGGNNGSGGSSGSMGMSGTSGYEGRVKWMLSHEY
jgi:hypothetical protein